MAGAVGLSWHALVRSAATARPRNGIAAERFKVIPPLSLRKVRVRCRTKPNDVRAILQLRRRREAEPLVQPRGLRRGGPKAQNRERRFGELDDTARQRGADRLPAV